MNQESCCVFAKFWDAVTVATVQFALVVRACSELLWVHLQFECHSLASGHMSCACSSNIIFVSSHGSVQHRHTVNLLFFAKLVVTDHL